VRRKFQLAATAATSSRIRCLSAKFLTGIYRAKYVAFESLAMPMCRRVGERNGDA
jgi:hypothetical protein